MNSTAFLHESSSMNRSPGLHVKGGKAPCPQSGTSHVISIKDLKPAGFMGEGVMSFRALRGAWVHGCMGAWVQGCMGVVFGIYPLKV